MNSLDYFEKWWAVYPRKVSKGAARKAWEKLTKGMDEDELKAFHWTTEQAILAQRKAADKAKESGDFVPDWKHPATWLNAECWLDDLGDIQEKPKAQLRKCKHCDRDVHGPSFDRCAYHLGFESGKLVHPFADELREQYKKMQIDPSKGKENLQAAKQLLGLK